VLLLLQPMLMLLPLVVVVVYTLCHIDLRLLSSMSACPQERE